jgi:hypothetical protein
MVQRVRGWALAHPVLATLATAFVLHAIWGLWIQNGGGDLAAQDAWAEFARAHPRTAYDLAWYGGIHPVSYSVISPYLMAYLGVRTTLAMAGVISSGLLALLLVRAREVREPLWPALYGALAIAGNSVSGRATFALGIMFGLASVIVVFTPDGIQLTGPHRVRRAVFVALFAGLATASSPVAGLFLGVAAAALWLRGRRLIAYAVGLPPVFVVVASALLFPFSGEQPMAPASAILPIIVGLCCAVMPPREWRTVRLGALFYVAGVVAVLVIPSQIGSNVTRLALIFGGVVLVAVATRHDPVVAWSRTRSLVGREAYFAIGAAVLTATIWQTCIAVTDVVNTRAADQWTAEVQPLVREFRAQHAELARVEVVPSRSHREASALAPYVNLARGWNRQADAGRNSIFYTDGALTAATYRAWLDRWAVHYVFLPGAEPDKAAIAEAALVGHGLPYLTEVWAGAGGRLYAVQNPAPLVDAPAIVTHFGAGEIVVRVPEPGSYRLRVLSSPWLALMTRDGSVIAAPSTDVPDAVPVDVSGCLTKDVEPAQYGGVDLDWTVLEAPHAGIYRISTPYTLPRGTACPTGEPIPGEMRASTP